MRHVFTIGIAVLPLVSVAAPPPIQLSAPPVAVVTESVTANSPSIAVTSGPSARANITPVPSVGGVNLPGVPPVVSRSAPRLEETPRPIAGFDTTPAESAPDPDRPITVKPGTTELVRIARGYLNRIVTPFSDPKLLSVNDLEVKKEGTSLFVATAAEQP
jgi:conjugal transfer pilus assembly protein TraK